MMRRWDWGIISSKRPRIVGKIIKDIAYARLTHGILKQLEEKNPANERGYRKARHHQCLTDDVSNPALAQRLHTVITLMNCRIHGTSFTGCSIRFFRRGELRLAYFFADPFA